MYIYQCAYTNEYINLTWGPVFMLSWPPCKKHPIVTVYTLLCLMLSCTLWCSLFHAAGSDGCGRCVSCVGCGGYGGCGGCSGCGECVGWDRCGGLAGCRGSAGCGDHSQCSGCERVWRMRRVRRVRRVQKVRRVRAGAGSDDMVGQKVWEVWRWL
jgi:hypothetical protein